MAWTDLLSGRGRTLLLSRLAAALGRQGARQTQAWHARHEQLAQQRISATGRGPARGRQDDLEAHVEGLRPQFEGASELCLHHARLCVKARRGLDPAATIEEFRYLWRTRADHLATSLDSRWLIAAADTFADYGTPPQRAMGCMISGFFNAFKLTESEWLALGGRPAADALTVAADPEPTPLWDGMESFRIQRGDMLRNLLERMERICADDPALGRIQRTLLERARAANSPLGRIMRANRFFRTGA